MTSIETPHPPGHDGLPLPCETLTFATNPFRFIEDRPALHGRLFRTRIPGRKDAGVYRHDAAVHFIDANVIMRDGAMPPHVQELFGGRSLPLLDGEVHSTRKKLVNSAFNRAAMAAYLPIIEETVERSFRAWPA